jgi:hypothetical protein
MPRTYHGSQNILLDVGKNVYRYVCVVVLLNQTCWWWCMMSGKITKLLKGWVKSQNLYLQQNLSKQNMQFWKALRYGVWLDTNFLVGVSVTMSQNTKHTTQFWFTIHVFLEYPWLFWIALSVRTSVWKPVLKFCSVNNTNQLPTHRVVRVDGLRNVGFLSSQVFWTWCLVWKLGWLWGWPWCLFHLIVSCSCVINVTSVEECMIWCGSGPNHNQNASIKG